MVEKHILTAFRNHMKKKIAGSQEFMDGLPEHLKKTMSESQKEILSEYFTQYLEVIGGRYKKLMEGLRDEFKKRPDLPTSKLTQIRDIKRERTPILEIYLLIKSFFKSDSVNVSNTTVKGDFVGRDLIKNSSGRDSLESEAFKKYKNNQ